MNAWARFTLGVVLFAGGVALGIVRGFGLLGQPQEADGAFFLVLILTGTGVYLIGSAVDM